MAETDRNEEVENITARSSITDPADVTHTGELADLDDVSDATAGNDRVLPDGTGNGLATQVENALLDILNNQGGQGAVIVTPKSDGTAWSWDKDLVIDPTDYEGLDLRFGSNVQIEYPGSGIALTLDSDWSVQNGNFEYNSNITGGEWYATGSSPEGCIRLEDSYRTLVTDVEIYDFEKDSPLTNGRETFGIQLRNVDGWCESTLVRDCRFDGTSICIDSEPADYNGGPGTTSFHDTVIENNRFEVQNIGIRCRGGFDYSSIIHNSFFSKGTDGDAKHIQLGGTDTNLSPSLDGTLIMGNKHEDPGGSAANDADDVAYVLEANYNGFFQPTLINNKIFLSDTKGGVGDGVLVDSNVSNARLIECSIEGSGVIFRNLTTATENKFFYDDLKDQFEATMGRYEATDTGSSSEPAIAIGSNGAGVFVDGNGDVVVVDDAGNTNTLT